MRWPDAYRLHAKKKPWSEKYAKSVGKRSLRDAFSLAQTLNYMKVVNPVDDMKTFPALAKEEEASRRKPRYPYSSKQLNTIFSSAWYDPNERGLFTGKIQKDLGARYWIPLLGLTHGNRVHEGSQLVCSDFSYDADGVFALTFRVELDEEGGGPPSKEHQRLVKLRSLKNDATKRTVAVHPALIALGLPEFIQERRQLGGINSLLFPSAMPEPDSKSPKLGRSYEQAFLRYVRDKLGFGSGFGNHSFRHQLEDRLRETQGTRGIWPPGLSLQYTGREDARKGEQALTQSEGSAKDYGKGYKAKVMYEHIKLIDFSDVTLPPAYDKWRQSP